MLAPDPASLKLLCSVSQSAVSHFALLKVASPPATVQLIIIFRKAFVHEPKLIMANFPETWKILSLLILARPHLCSVTVAWSQSDGNNSTIVLGQRVNITYLGNTGAVDIYLYWTNGDGNNDIIACKSLALSSSSAVADLLQLRPMRIHFHGYPPLKVPKKTSKISPDQVTTSCCTATVLL